MELHFISAADNTPLTKRFEREPDGSYRKAASYPHVVNVNSVHVEVATPQQFFGAVKQAAEHNAYLLTGKLDRVLKNESRAGCTLPHQESEWVVFDLDDLTGTETAEEFIHKILPPAFHDATYVLQLSCSSGITDGGLRAHLFFSLESPVEPSKIKLWLTEANLNHPLLSSQLTLNAGGGSLRYPLDRVANDHGRPVFIAPPVCTNFEDPLADQRIQLITKSRDRVEFDFRSSTRQVIRKHERKVIQRLRAEAGLAHREMRVHNKGDFDVLLDADPVEVTEWWEANGFIHANLNGGDSGAYWVNPKRPKYVHNFKGEPSLILRNVAPEWWEQIKSLCGTEEMLVFRDPISGRYYHGIYDAVEDRHSKLHRIVRADIKDWAEDIFNASAPDPIPQYDLIFDPTIDKVVDRKNRFVNEFQPTEYMGLTIDPDENYKVPPTVRKLLVHLCGNDEDAFEWFLNWLACIFQFRRKTKTAIVLYGVPGTGKGLLYTKVLAPLFGAYTQAVQLDNLSKDMFNGFLGRSLIVQVEESEANREMRNKLFHWIADEKITLRKMYQEGHEQETYCNFIFVSNQLDAVKIEARDRRFTVAPWQEQPLQDQPDGRKGIMTDEEIDDVLPTEIGAFARYLLSRPAALGIARKPLENEAKHQMRLDSMSVADLFVEALKSGNFIWFLERLREDDGYSDWKAKEILARCLPYVNSSKPCPMFKYHLLVLYKFISNKENLGEVAFGNLLKNRQFPIPAGARVTIDGERKSGCTISWKADSDLLQEYADLFAKEEKANVASNPLEEEIRENLSDERFGPKKARPH